MKTKYKKIYKWISGENFVKLIEKKFKRSCMVEQFEHMKEGEQLCMIRNKEKKTEIFYFLQKTFIKKFTLGYSNHPNKRSGREILISNMNIPPVHADDW